MASFYTSNKYVIINLFNIMIIDQYFKIAFNLLLKKKSNNVLDKYWKSAFGEKGSQEREIVQ
jgi:hypothetical protein